MSAPLISFTIFSLVASYLSFMISFFFVYLSFLSLILFSLSLYSSFFYSFPAPPFSNFHGVDAIGFVHDTRSSSSCRLLNDLNAKSGRTKHTTSHFKLNPTALHLTPLNAIPRCQKPHNFTKLLPTHVSYHTNPHNNTLHLSTPAQALSLTRLPNKAAHHIAAVHLHPTLHAYQVRVGSPG